MKPNITRQSHICLALLLAHLFSAPALAADSRRDSVPSGWRAVNVFQTNVSERVVTNLVEVRMPRNTFVTEYHTNWIERTLTNLVEVVLTNWSTKTITNTVAIDLTRTNFVDRYSTNWTMVTVTNLTTLTLTNWENVVVTKTNWVRQAMTNLVEVNAVADASAVLQPEAKVAPSPEAALNALVIDVVKTSRLTENNQLEVKFKVRLTSDPEAALEVQQWRVERDDGAVLFFAQTQEFKHGLPSGRYLVQVKARRDSESPFLSIRRTLDVSRDAVVQR